MAEQKAVAKFLSQDDAVQRYLQFIKGELSVRLTRIFEGFQALKSDGFPVDAIAPQAAIYLTVQVNLLGKTTADGTVLDNQAAVTAYLLNEAKLALVPFNAFGAEKESNWYRLSVGCCKKEEIDTMLVTLKEGLQRLH